MNSPDLAPCLFSVNKLSWKPTMCIGLPNFYGCLCATRTKCNRGRDWKAVKQNISLLALHRKGLLTSASGTWCAIALYLSQSTAPKCHRPGLPGQPLSWRSAGPLGCVFATCHCKHQTFSITCTTNGPERWGRGQAFIGLWGPSGRKGLVLPALSGALWFLQSVSSSFGWPSQWYLWGTLILLS